MQGKDNIENFLKKSADNLGSEFQDDWNVFDKKLAQAKNLKFVKRFTAGTAVAAAVVYLFMTFNGYQMFWNTDFYIPRTKDVVFEEPTEIPPIQENKTTTNVEPSNTITYSDDLVNSTKGKALSTPNSEGLNSLNSELVASQISTTPPNIIGSTSTVNNLRNTSITSPLEENGEGPLVSRAEEIERIDRLENPKEELLFLNSKRGFGTIHSSSGIEAKTKENDKYLSFEVEQLSKVTQSGDVVMALKSPVNKVDFSKINNGPYISPLQAKNAWSYSINMYPNYTFRKFELDESKANLLHADFADAVQAAESGGLSLNVGFEVNRRIAPVTYLNTGIEYISYKTDVLYNFSNFRDPIINKGSGFIDGYTIKDKAERVSFSDKNIYHYVNIPFSVSYQPWASDHVRLNIEAGASFLYFMAANGQTLDYKTLDIVNLSQQEFRNTMGSFCMKIGANYYVNERINIGFEPTLMYFTNTIYDDDYPFYVIPYSVGLNFNLQVKLN